MTVELHDLPAIGGLRLRRLQRPGDDAVITDLINAGNAADGISHRMVPEQITTWLDHPSGIDPAQDLLFAEVDGAVVAYAEAGWEQDNDGGRDYTNWGQVHPEWRRRGLGTALLRWVEERQRTVAATHPEGIERRLQSWAHENETGRIALLEGNGYQVVRRDYEMGRPTLDDIPDMPLPAGIELRPAREEHVRAVWETDVEVFRDHFGAVDDSEAAFERVRDDPRRDLRLWVIAWDGDQIAGIVRNRIDREGNAELGIKRGWVSSVGVRRPWRGRGLGRAIVAESLRVLRDAGMTSAGLGVDAENGTGALGVYAAVGFSVTGTERVYRKPL